MKSRSRKMFFLFIALAIVTITVISLAFSVVYFMMITPANAATSDSSVGYFTLNAVPTVTNVEYVDASYATETTFNPDDSTIYGINATVGSTAGLSDIKNVTFYFYDDSVYGSNYDSSSADGLQLVIITWVESTDTWTLDDGAFTTWTEQSSVDPGTGSGSTSFEFTARFDISKAARADTDWNATVVVYDDANPISDSATATASSTVTMAQYFEVSFSAATFTWGTNVQVSSTNNTHGALSLQIYANAAWELRFNGTDFNDTAGDVDIEANNILALDEDGTFSGGDSMWVRNSIQTATSLSTWDGQSAMSDESGFSRNVYIGLNPGSLFTAGEVHAFTFWVFIQANA